MQFCYKRLREANHTTGVRMAYMAKCDQVKTKAKPSGQKSKYTHTIEEETLVKMFLTLLDFTNRFTVCKVHLVFPNEEKKRNDDTMRTILMR